MIGGTTGIFDTMTSEQLKAARAMLRMEQRELAKLARVTQRTIARIEGAPGTVSGSYRTVDQIKKVLESRGIVFTETGVGWDESKTREGRD